MEVVLLFSKPVDYNATVPPYLVDKYPGVQCFIYEDNRVDKSYIPSIRPYLLWQYFKNDPRREQEDYFYIDSDIIFREWPDFSAFSVSSKHWVGSNCDGYIGAEYIRKCENGISILRNMARICHINPRKMIGVPGIGAHIVMSRPTAQFWKDCYERTLETWHYLDGTKSNIQKWTAEMWAQLWTMVEYGIELSMPSELDFCMATDPIEKYDKVKILHNAGVTSSKEMFFKGNYVDKTPFGEDFSYVNPEKCSKRYIEALEKVIH